MKAALTKTYKSRIQDRVVRSADLLPPMALPGQKKAIKKPKRLVLDEAVVGDGDNEVIKEEELLLSGVKGVPLDICEQFRFLNASMHGLLSAISLWPSTHDLFVIKYMRIYTSLVTFWGLPIWVR